GDTLGDQTRQAFRNMTSAIESVGGKIEDICSITVYVQDTDLQKDVYPQINPAVFEVFADKPPARAVVGGVSLPRSTEKVMISAYAVVGA
ncbi:MAG TPA: RidA family protein, partial [Nordella sp.]|nr:RidA family protein [Nordella sp.]